MPLQPNFKPIANHSNHGSRRGVHDMPNPCHNQAEACSTQDNVAENSRNYSSKFPVGFAKLNPLQKAKRAILVRESTIMLWDRIPGVLSMMDSTRGFGCSYSRFDLSVPVLNCRVSKNTRSRNSSDLAYRTALLTEAWRMVFPGCEESQTMD